MEATERVKVLEEALREIADKAEGCISANALQQYASCRENRQEGVRLSAKIKTAQTVLNIAAAARAALTQGPER